VTRAEARSPSAAQYGPQSGRARQARQAASQARRTGNRGREGAAGADAEHPLANRSIGKLASPPLFRPSAKEGVA